MKTYQLKALWPLLSFEVAAAPLRATLDAYGGGLVKYAVDHEGLWLFAPAQLLGVNESEALTGFHPADLMPKKIDGVDGYFYGRQDGSPLLPIPFTTDQLSEFETRTADFVAGSIERGSETDAWIDDLEKNNLDAAELARGIRYGTWPEDSDTDMATIQAAFVAAVGTSEPPKKQRVQEKRILELLTAQGIDPLNLPTRKAGARGVKAEIKVLALRENSIFSDNSFDKTWGRLRGYRDIAGG